MITFILLTTYFQIGTYIDIYTLCLMGMVKVKPPDFLGTRANRNKLFWKAVYQF